jgi:hypothetical protein
MKLKVKEILKSPKRSVYIFPKNKDFLSIYGEILNSFQLHDLEAEGKNIHLDIAENSEGYYNFSNNDFDVDIFIGTNQIVMTIRTGGDMQQEISDIIFRYADF